MVRLVTFCCQGNEQVGILIEDKIVPINQLLGTKFASMLDLIELITDQHMNAADKAIKSGDYKALPLQEVKLLAPIPFPPRNVFCLGKNYADHAREIKMTKISDTGIPDCPIYFTKIASPAITDGDDIVFSPQTTTQVDYEVELAVVIGREGPILDMKKPKITSSAILSPMTYQPVTCRGHINSGSRERVWTLFAPWARSWYTSAPCRCR